MKILLILVKGALLLPRLCPGTLQATCLRNALNVTQGQRSLTRHPLSNPAYLRPYLQLLGHLQLEHLP